MNLKQLFRTYPLVAAVFLLGCSGDNSTERSGTKTNVSAEEAQTISRDAYVYGFPLVMNLKTIYDYDINV